MQWGDVATWVGSVTTSATLILTLSIVLGDRRRAAAQQARLIYHNVIDDLQNNGCTIKIRNNSTLQITSLDVGAFWPHKSGLHLGETISHWNVLNPQEEVTSDFIDFREFRIINMRMEVSFTDAKGRDWWVRDPERRRIVRKPERYGLVGLIIDSRSRWMVHRLNRHRRKVNT